MPWYHYRMSGLVFGDDPDMCLDTLRAASEASNGLVRIKRADVGDACEVTPC